MQLQIGWLSIVLKRGLHCRINHDGWYGIRPSVSPLPNRQQEFIRVLPTRDDLIFTRTVGVSTQTEQQASNALSDGILPDSRWYISVLKLGRSCVPNIGNSEF